MAPPELAQKATNGMLLSVVILIKYLVQYFQEFQTCLLFIKTYR